MWPASDLLLPPFKLAPLSNRAASTRSFFEALIADDDFWPTADAVIPQSLGDLSYRISYPRLSRPPIYFPGMLQAILLDSLRFIRQLLHRSTSKFLI
jgi:hypothetical protein